MGLHLGKKLDRIVNGGNTAPKVNATYTRGEIAALRLSFSGYISDIGSVYPGIDGIAGPVDIYSGTIGRYALREESDGMLRCIMRLR